MVEVFKTNVADPKHANLLKEQIKSIYTDYFVTFDLEDCDRILRIKTSKGEVKTDSIINILNDFGFNAQVLPDNYPLVIKSLLNKSI